MQLSIHGFSSAGVSLEPFACRYQGPIVIFKDVPQGPTSSSQALPPTFHHLPIILSKFESIDGLNIG
jgi:hypothetical protein